MKARYVDVLIYALFGAVMLTTIYLSTLWTEESLLYHLIYEGI